MSGTIEIFLLTLSILFFVSLLATKASTRFGVPVLLIFLAVGMLFGGDGLGLDFESLQLANGVGTVALSLILFSGGLNTRLADVKPTLAPGLTLATLGVLVITFVGAIFIWIATNLLIVKVSFTFLEALLLSAIMSSTDSASVFNILRTKELNLKYNLGRLLEVESGSNDPMAYMLTTTFMSLIISTATFSIGKVVFDVILSLGVGALAGLAVGYIGIRIINKINLNNEALYPILIVTMCIFSFSATYFLHGNGYLAVYISGLVLGNGKIVNKRSSVNFFEGLSWLSQITLFLTLGLLVRPHELLGVLLSSIVIGASLIFIARPISVAVCMAPFRQQYNLDSMKFIVWGGLRGAVPVVFAILPLVADTPNARVMFNIVFFISLISLLLQGTTLASLAVRWGLIEKTVHGDTLKHFGIELDEGIKSAMSEILLTETQLVDGNRLVNLDLPDKTLAVMVKRKGSYFIPKGNTELASGDRLLVITDDENALRETYESMGIHKYNLKKQD
ncbi:potassium/proton antiporter [Deferribacterales bacterium RsTz2092]|nr:K+/H+ antiporter [Deferribacterales bacterium]